MSRCELITGIGLLDIAARQFTEERCWFSVSSLMEANFIKAPKIKEEAKETAVMVTSDSVSSKDSK